MNELNFLDLMRKVSSITDLNARELALCEARANFQQTVLSMGNAYLMQIESAIALIRKERELTVSVSTLTNVNQEKSNNLKIAVCLILEMLKLLGKGRDVNDLTTLSWLASIITGFSKDSILNTAQKGFYFSKQYHGVIIQEVNEVLQRLQMPFVIDIARKY
jgi:hypothetical protein